MFQNVASCWDFHNLSVGDDDDKERSDEDEDEKEEPVQKPSTSTTKAVSPSSLESDSEEEKVSKHKIKTQKPSKELKRKDRKDSSSLESDNELRNCNHTINCSLLFKTTG